MKARKKPVVIETFRWTIDEVPEWWTKLVNLKVGVDTGSVFIPTLEGVMEAKVGDFIIQGVQGEVYPCKPDIFEKTYDILPEEVE